MKSIKSRLHIFDMDGTIIDSMSIWRGINERYLHSKIEFDELEFKAKIAGKPFSEIYEIISQDYLPDMKPGDIYDELMDMAVEGYNDLKIEFPALYYIKLMKEKGHKVAIGTANDRRVVEKVLKDNDMEDLFDVIVTSSETGFAFHDKNAIYDLCVEKANSHKHLTTIYEDSEMALRNANKVGYNSLVLINSNNLDTSIIDYPCKIANNFREVSSNMDTQTRLVRHIKSFDHMLHSTIDFIENNESAECPFEITQLGGIIVPMRIVHNVEVYLLPGTISAVYENQLYGKSFDLIDYINNKHSDMTYSDIVCILDEIIKLQWRDLNIKGFNSDF